MCGICGFVSNSVISLEQLEKMNNTMVNRGPDDAGAEIFTTGYGDNIGFAHRRLSIIDLSKNGHQPFHSNDDRIIVVFNGEIYNFLELKSELSEYRFRSTCDTEVLVAAYEKWGEDFVKHFNGMFAIALYDKQNDRLLLARDRIGKKPLYYSLTENEFVFSSTLKAIFEYPGFVPEINKDILPRYITNGYIGGSDCILKNVFKIQPGQLLVYENHRISVKKYWSLIEEYSKARKLRYSNYEEAKKEIKRQLIDSVKRRMIADVPVGTFLSGGYDSALVTAIAQSISEKPIKSFSIGFEEKEYDEAPYAKAIAEHLGTEHTNHYVTESEMLELVDSIPEYYDEPFADSSEIPSMLVAKIAKRDVAVALSGDGGDELFCGYKMYDKLYTAQKLEPFARIIRLFVRSERLINKFPYAVRAVLHNKDKRFKTQFGREYYEDVISHIIDCTVEDQHYDESYIPEKNWQIRRMLLDSTTYLPDNNLCKVDRATMRYSLEGRNPILDYQVVEKALKIPQSFKYHKKDKKHILKDITYDYIPRQLMERPKMGFAVPIDKWMRGPLKNDVLRLTEVGFLKKQGIFNPEYTSDFVRKYLEEGDSGAFTGKNPSQIVWPLFVFQKWYVRYIEK